MLRRILIATLIAGTLDLLAAFYFAGRAGMTPGGVLLFVASGPFGDGVLSDPRWRVVGALVHYGIMACMVTVYLLAAARLPVLRRWAIPAGALYGLLLWFVMYWIVRPMRWEQLRPSTDPEAIASQLFCHVLLVGIPIALVAARKMRRTSIFAGAR